MHRPRSCPPRIQGTTHRRITTAGDVPSHLGGPARCGSWDAATAVLVAAKTTSGRKRSAMRSAQIRKVRIGRQRDSAARVRRLGRDFTKR